MSREDTDESRANFEFLSNEYAQALQAYKTIEMQAGTLLLLSGTEDLFQFLDRFIEMASKTMERAVATNEPNFVEWFGELIARAQELRTTVASRKS
jgi:hypothetical protein